MNNNEYLKFAIGIAKYAGEVMRDYFFNKDLNTVYKDDNTPVTDADKHINHYLIEQVSKTYPNHSVDGEEEKMLKGSNYVWVCDPIDGTSMFTRHVPVSMFSLALVIDGVPTVAVTYDPFLNDLYTAIKGEGAYLNGQLIHVNSKNYGEQASAIDYCMWHNAKYDTLKIVEDLRKDFKTCQVGSVVHGCMLVATGRTCGEIFPGVAHGHCDMAASKLIVEEAGGRVTNFNGEEQRYDRDIDGAIVTNGVIHEQLLTRIKKSLGN